jgi:hypothetical protein
MGASASITSQPGDRFARCLARGRSHMAPRRMEYMAIPSPTRDSVSLPKPRFTVQNEAQKMTTLTVDPTLLQEMIPLQPPHRIIIPRRLEIPTHMRLPHAVHLKIPRRKVAPLKCEVRVAQRLLPEVIQAVLVVRESAIVVVSAVGQLRVEVEEAMLLVVKRHRERPVVGTKARRAVESKPALVPPLLLPA